MPIEDSDSEGGRSSSSPPGQSSSEVPAKRAPSEEIDCITLDSDSEDDEQVRNRGVGGQFTDQQYCASYNPV